MGYSYIEWFKYKLAELKVTQVKDRASLQNRSLYLEKNLCWG